MVVEAAWACVGSEGEGQAAGGKGTECRSGWIVVVLVVVVGVLVLVVGVGVVVVVVGAMGAVVVVCRLALSKCWRVSAKSIYQYTLDS